jgi:hypothetical protein
VNLYAASIRLAATRLTNNHGEDAKRGQNVTTRTIRVTTNDPQTLAKKLDMLNVSHGDIEANVPFTLPATTEPFLQAVREKGVALEIEDVENTKHVFECDMTETTTYTTYLSAKDERQAEALMERLCIDGVIVTRWRHDNVPLIIDVSERETHARRTTTETEALDSNDVQEDCERTRPVERDAFVSELLVRELLATDDFAKRAQAKGLTLEDAECVKAFADATLSAFRQTDVLNEKLNDIVSNDSHLARLIREEIERAVMDAALAVYGETMRAGTH